MGILSTTEDRGSVKMDRGEGGMQAAEEGLSNDKWGGGTEKEVWVCGGKSTEGRPSQEEEFDAAMKRLLNRI